MLEICHEFTSFFEDVQRIMWYRPTWETTYKDAWGWIYYYNELWFKKSKKMLYGFSGVRFPIKAKFPSTSTKSLLASLDQGLNVASHLPYTNHVRSFHPPHTRHGVTFHPPLHSYNKTCHLSHPIWQDRSFHPHLHVTRITLLPPLHISRWALPPQAPWR